MSKSKKNTIDPETMISNMVLMQLDGLFYQIVHLKRDVQWTDTGVASANKFLQKNLEYKLRFKKNKRKIR